MSSAQPRTLSSQGVKRLYLAVWLFEFPVFVPQTLFREMPEPEVVEAEGAENDLNAIRNHVLAKVSLSILHSDASSPSKIDHILAVLNTFSTDIFSNETEALEAVYSKIYCSFLRVMSGLEFQLRIPVLKIWRNTHCIQ